jgi:hypothetical protein
VIFSTPRRLARVSAWREHIPFGMFLVDLLQPRVLVELGTHWGNSYCAFCQAVQELELDTKCYAVDTWTGDKQSGLYGPEVLADLRAHHDPLYGSFSRLVESTFDEALKGFADGSVDLLHIDGLHTYDAVKHDFESWVPKLSDRGVVVLHDINARRKDYGVWQLWEELRDRYPHLELHHAHGLGVLAVGGSQPDEFRELLDTPSRDIQPLRDLFYALGYRLRLQLHLEDARRKQQELHKTLEAQKAAWRESIDRAVHIADERGTAAHKLRDKVNEATHQRDSAQAELAEFRRRWPVRVARLADFARREISGRVGLRDGRESERG